ALGYASPRGSFRRDRNPRRNTAHRRCTGAYQRRSAGVGLAGLQGTARRFRSHSPRFHANRLATQSDAVALVHSGDLKSEQSLVNCCFSLVLRSTMHLRIISMRQQCPLLAQSGYLFLRRTCPPSGVERTWLFVTYFAYRGTAPTLPVER